MAPKNMMPRTQWILLLLVGSILFAFLPVINHPFINLDDAQYVWNNQYVKQGLSWEGLAWASHTGYMGNWHPVTWISHMLDVQLFGPRPGWHHLTSLLLHVANAVLLFLVLRRAVSPKDREAGTSNIQPRTSNTEQAGRTAPHPACGHPLPSGWGEGGVRGASSAETKGRTSNVQPRTSNLENPTSNIQHPTWLCAMVAALFALHPLRVESVAWIAERKDVLSGFFFMLTLWAYIRYAECGARPSAECGLRSAESESRFTVHASLFYLLSLTFFALGLMSKGMLVTVPFILLLLDFWPLKRMRVADCGVRNAESVASDTQHATRNTSDALRSALHTPRGTLLPLLLEKVPFLVLTIAGSVATFVAQQHYGAVKSLEALPATSRLCNVLAAYLEYLRQTVWPSGLAVFYPMQSAPASAGVAVAGLLLIGLSAWAVASIWRRPHVFVGWFWFVGMLVPVIGLVHIGHQQRADRYTYLPLIGLFVLVVWEASRQWAALKLKPTLLGIAAVVLLITCLGLTRLQVSYWASDEKLFRHAVKVTRDNWFAQQLLGRALVFRGKPDEAIHHYQVAAAIHPSPELRKVLGEVLGWRGRLEEAADQFSEVLRQNPDDVPVLVQLGVVRTRQGQLDAAELAFIRALRLAPADPTVHNSFGDMLAQQGKHEHALHQFEEALRLAPEYAEAHYNLAVSCTKLQRTNEAISHYREAIRLQPQWSQVVSNLNRLPPAQPRLVPGQFSNGLPAGQGGSTSP